MKKTLLVGAIFSLLSTTTIAGTSYVGGSLGLTNLGVTAGQINAGAIGKLFGGYGSTFGADNNIYLGGELNIDAAHYPYDDGATYGVGASIIPGVMVSEHTMIYGRVGIEANRNSLSSTTQVGTQVGVGFQTKLKGNWDIRPEFVYVSNVPGSGGGNSQLNIGLVYKFD